MEAAEDLGGAIVKKCCVGVYVCEWSVVESVCV